MNKKMAFTPIILLFFLTVSAQQRTGDIYGKVTGPQGAPLSGIKITLSGSLIGPMRISASKKGSFQFVSLPPACDYGIIVELDGFKKSILKNIQVLVGGHTRVNISLEQGDSSQEVVTLAPTPLTDARTKAVAQTVTRNELQSLPAARDPWAVLQQAPGVMVDRENVGGSESGNQSGFAAKGLLNTSNNIWALDGVDITDPNALGASLIYYDFDTFEQIHISTGGNDLSLQTGGAAINLVTGRGSNKHHLSGRFYFADSAFEAKIKRDWFEGPVIQSGYFPGYYLSEKPVNNIKDYGFNVGGPILKEKIWYWGSAGMQEIKTTKWAGHPDNTLLTNFNFKLNSQLIASNRFEALLSVSNKEESGRDSSPQQPEGFYQRAAHHFGSPIVKIQDEQTFGSNIFVSAKYAFSNVGFGLWPMIDRDLQRVPGWDVAAGKWLDSANVYLVKRPRNVVGLSANYFNDKFLGLSQELKVGGEFQDKHEEYVGSTTGLWWKYDYNYAIIDMDHSGSLDWAPNAFYLEFHRQYTNVVAVKQWVGYISDTISKGNFTLLLGLRYDRQMPYIKPFTVAGVMNGTTAWDTGGGSFYFKGVNSAVATAWDAILPAVSIAPPSNPTYLWNTWSPRIGLTYDLGGKGKTIIKLGGSMYGDIMAASFAGNFAPRNAGGWLDFWWMDKYPAYGGNNDGKVDLAELYWRHRSGVPGEFQLYPVFDSSGNVIANPTDGFQDGFWGNFDWSNGFGFPGYQYNYFAKNAQSSRTSELIASVEHEIFKDIAVSLTGTYRRFDHFNIGELYYPADIWHAEELTGGTFVDFQSKYYVPAGTVPAYVGGYSTGDAAGRTWYVLDPSQVTRTDLRYYIRDTEHYYAYTGADLVLTKRLANKWMANFSFTYQDQKDHWGKHQGDPTNKWALDKGVYAAYTGGASGKFDQYIFSRWLVKLSGMYQLPFGFNISATFNARQGNMIPRYFTIQDDRLTGIQNSNTIYIQKLDQDRLPTFWEVNLRLEKMFRLGDIGKIWLMADVFNLFNKQLVTRRSDGYLGIFHVDTGILIPYAQYQENLNPLLLRLGVRFEL